ncbi:uncharacterized protein F4807DRAFT_286820 [Annulohypoxylon truncatum]|uniref:uncharacterized protein n=1 Tax=Annulohypoxylon truncatum TaxID=327061 RepID=UPI002008E3B2|nr:uncharacterized protein F4807DRAFT_286820 [Annulohypoxylon truncatum]KAI1205284.1 hypothetical protein F4807DRAFT_286820 [Annulohypoxylon truncatum]
MPRPTSRTLFVVVPGASQSPSHYGYLLHLLQSKGYPTLSALLPSTGVAKDKEPGAVPGAHPWLRLEQQHLMGARGNSRLLTTMVIHQGNFRVMHMSVATWYARP